MNKSIQNKLFGYRTTGKAYEKKISYPCNSQLINFPLLQTNHLFTWNIPRAKIRSAGKFECEIWLAEHWNLRHTVSRNAEDGEYTKKFVARNVAEEGRDSTAAILRATILGVDTRCNSAIARSIAPWIRTFSKVTASWIILALNVSTHLLGCYIKRRWLRSITTSLGVIICFGYGVFRIDREKWPFVLICLFWKARQRELFA